MLFLGHILSIDGNWVDTQNIKAVQSWPRPMSTTDINIFLGLAGYYRIFLGVFIYLVCLDQVNLEEIKVSMVWILWEKLLGIEKVVDYIFDLDFTGGYSWFCDVLWCKS